MYMNDVKAGYADFIDISFVSYLPGDGFILRTACCTKPCCIQQEL